MIVSGSLTVNTPTGQVVLQGDDFHEEEFLNGPEVEINHEADDWSVKKIFGGEQGRGDGDWETENCTIISDNIRVLYHEDEEE